MSRGSGAKALNRIRTPVSKDPEAYGAVCCGTAVLVDFDVRFTVYPGHQGLMGVNLWLSGHYTVEKLWENRNSWECPTLAQFMRQRPKGDYLMITGVNYDRHAMALRDGRLTDTDLAGGGRRRINIAYRVTDR